VRLVDRSGFGRAWLLGAIAALVVGTPLVWAVARWVSAPADRTIRVGVVQLEATGDTVEAGRARAEGLIRQAAGEGARFVLLPELYAMFPAARAHRSLDAIRAEAEPIPGPLTDSMTALARELDVQIAFGMTERDGNLLYNSIALVGPNGVAGRYRKRNLITMEAVGKYFEKIGAPVEMPDDGALDEAAMFARGKVPVVVPWGGVPTGVLTCADGGFDPFWKTMRRQGAEMILWPTSSLGRYTEEQISPTDQATALGVPVLHANRALPDLELGSSVIVDRDGRIVASAGDDYGDAVLVADVHLPPAR
jgi:predicted amidohydrolase